MAALAVVLVAAVAAVAAADGPLVAVNETFAGDGAGRWVEPDSDDGAAWAVIRDGCAVDAAALCSGADAVVPGPLHADERLATTREQHVHVIERRFEAPLAVPRDHVEVAVGATPSPLSAAGPAPQSLLVQFQASFRQAHRLCSSGALDLVSDCFGPTDPDGFALRFGPQVDCDDKPTLALVVGGAAVALPFYELEMHRTYLFTLLVRDGWHSWEARIDRERKGGGVFAVGVPAPEGWRTAVNGTWIVFPDDGDLTVPEELCAARFSVFQHMAPTVFDNVLVATGTRSELEQLATDRMDALLCQQAAERRCDRCDQILGWYRQQPSALPRSAAMRARYSVLSTWFKYRLERFTGAVVSADGHILLAYNLGADAALGRGYLVEPSGVDMSAACLLVERVAVDERAGMALYRVAHGIGTDSRRRVAKRPRPGILGLPVLSVAAERHMPRHGLALCASVHALEAVAIPLDSWTQNRYEMAVVEVPDGRLCPGAVVVDPATGALLGMEQDGAVVPIWEAAALLERAEADARIVQERREAAAGQTLLVRATGEKEGTVGFRIAPGGHIVTTERAVRATLPHHGLIDVLVAGEPVAAAVAVYASPALGIAILECQGIAHVPALELCADDGDGACGKELRCLGDGLEWERVTLGSEHLPSEALGAPCLDADGRVAAMVVEVEAHRYPQAGPGRDRDIGRRVATKVVAVAVPTLF